MSDPPVMDATEAPSSSSPKMPSDDSGPENDMAMQRWPTPPRNRERSSIRIHKPMRSRSSSSSSGSSSARSGSGSTDASSNIRVRVKTSRRQAAEIEARDRAAWRSWLLQKPQIVGTAEYEWEAFKNRSGDEHGRHIIEVLRAGANTLDDMIREKRMRKGLPIYDNVKTSSTANTSDTWIQRIRIQSAPVKAHLARAGVLRQSRSKYDMPHTFLRPFEALNHAQPQMKMALAKLEERWHGKDEPFTSNGTDRSRSEESRQSLEGKTRNNKHQDGDKTTTGSTPRNDSFTEEVMNSFEALTHMRHYVHFIDEQVVPLFSIYGDRLKSKRKIAFNDLGLLFRPGQLVYKSSLKPSDQPVFRVLNAHRVKYSAAPDDIALHVRKDQFDITCYYLDYDGAKYGVITDSISISCYEGQKDITGLAVYPLHYKDEFDKLQADLKAQGDLFRSLITQHYLYYEGWANLAKESDDRYRVDEIRNSKAEGHPEHIESPVIIDFEEAFKHQPFWRPSFEQLEDYEDEEWRTDQISIRHRTADGARGRLEYEINEEVCTDDPTPAKLSNHYMKSKGSIIASRSSSFDDVTDEDVVLLPRRVVAYALRDRKFVFLDVFLLRNPKEHPDIFRDLKIDPKHKRMVNSLVKGHFDNRKLGNKRGLVSLNQDLVYGKGSGLFILLHGAPGVGKTATAEAIAQYHKKPLFSITCGVLGLTPEKVEAELKEIFRLAHLWDCVLLLDEADVFLSRRDTASLQRNALVSVFLRVLEYYSGILFLTTNRVGTIDEAFKSRCHVSLYYERLDESKTMAIFWLNIKKLKQIEEDRVNLQDATSTEFPQLIIDEGKIMDFAREHWKQLGKARAGWNGRQIRNAFQTAASMARYDMGVKTLEQEGGSPGQDRKSGTDKPRVVERVLDDRQFRLVEEAINRFDAYFESAFGENDEAFALLEGTRNDRMRNKDLDSYARARRAEATPSRVVKESSSGYGRTGSGKKPQYPDDDSYERRRYHRGAGDGRREKDYYDDDESEERSPRRPKRRDEFGTPEMPSRESRLHPSSYPPEGGRDKGTGVRRRREERYDDVSRHDFDDGGSAFEEDLEEY